MLRSASDSEDTQWSAGRLVSDNAWADRLKASLRSCFRKWPLRPDSCPQCLHL